MIRKTYKQSWVGCTYQFTVSRCDGSFKTRIEVGEPINTPHMCEGCKMYAWEMGWFRKGGKLNP